MVWLKQIYLDRYQSFRSRTFKFEEGVNAICGLNGSGKTTMINGIKYALVATTSQEQDPMGNVTLFFENDNGETIELQRVRGTEDDEFVVDGFPATESEYKAKLKSMGFASTVIPFAINTNGNWKWQKAGDKMADCIEAANEEADGLREQLEGICRQFHDRNKDRKTPKKLIELFKEVRNKRNRFLSGILPDFSEHVTKNYQTIWGSEKPKRSISFSAEKPMNPIAGMEMVVDHGPKEPVHELSPGQATRAWIAFNTTIAQWRGAPLIIFDDTEDAVYGEDLEKLANGFKDLSKEIQIFVCCRQPKFAEHLGNAIHLS